MFAPKIAILILGLMPDLIFADDQSNRLIAIEKIELLGGKVEIDETLPGRPVISVDFGQSFRGRNKRFNNKYLHVLDSFTSLKKLNLANTDTTDDGLKVLNSLGGLTTLNLFGTKITDAGMANVGTLSELKTLQLGGVQITDDGLKEIRGLSKLETLVLWKTQITDNSLTDLAELKNLRVLCLSSTRITDRGLQRLISLEKLKTIDLANTRTSYDGMRVLQARLPKLEILNLEVPIRIKKHSNNDLR